MATIQSTNSANSTNKNHAVNETNSTNGESSMKDYSSMSREELMKQLATLEEANAKLEKAKTLKVKDQVLALIKAGFNTIQDVAEELKITSKNVSSNLTYLRADLEAENKTIISHKSKDGKTLIAIVSLDIFN